MPAVYTSKDPKCGSCEYWKGSRKTNPDGKSALANRYDKGICTNAQAAKHNQLVEPAAGCESWSKWPELK